MLENSTQHNVRVCRKTPETLQNSRNVFKIYGILEKIRNNSKEVQKNVINSTEF